MDKPQLYFITALYNEEEEVTDLLKHVTPIVDGFRIVDDGSTDNTVLKIKAYSQWALSENKDFMCKTIMHTGLPETVKSIAKEMVPDGAWCLMLDADERLSVEAFIGIQEFLKSEEILKLDYIYFNQYELIDNQHVRTFQKVKLFKKSAVQFPLNNIHADDVFTGNGIFKESWIIFHRKSINKQIKREQEYLDTYKYLLDEGHIDEGRYRWLIGLHHYIKPRT